MYDLSIKYAIIGLLVIQPAIGAEQPLAAEISSIKFSLADENLDQFGFSLGLTAIADRVSKNLAEWRYPVKLGDNHYSHTLIATLDKISHQATPTGFSYSSGNSDPRSPEFQQANVLPISCRLTKIPANGTNLEHKMTFSTPLLSAEAKQTKVLDKLIDQISTACFALLDDLKLPTADNTPSFKPTWMPEVLVEIKPAPVVSKSTEANDDSRKQITIYNQGSPLTIELGHQRR
jgi:hypothetical protein